jgi:hypothetical protein
MDLVRAFGERHHYKKSTTDKWQPTNRMDGKWQRRRRTSLSVPTGRRMTTGLCFWFYRMGVG